MNKWINDWTCGSAQLTQESIGLYNLNMEVKRKIGYVCSWNSDVLKNVASKI